ncbi:MAG: peptide-methionine (S)-S-oxide reductase, partial [Betaproteobacteria bacterium]
NEARQWIACREDADRIAMEVLPLTNYIASDPEHQDRLALNPSDSCHIPISLLHKYKSIN